MISVFFLVIGIIYLLELMGVVGEKYSVNFAGYMRIINAMLLISAILDYIFSYKAARKNRSKTRTKTEKIILLIMAVTCLFWTITFCAVIFS